MNIELKMLHLVHFPALESEEKMFAPLPARHGIYGENKWVCRLQITHSCCIVGLKWMTGVLRSLLFTSQSLNSGEMERPYVLMGTTLGTHLFMVFVFAMYRRDIKLLPGLRKMRQSRICFTEWIVLNIVGETRPLTSWVQESEICLIKILINSFYYTIYSYPRNILL